jgi:hypothetical protein
MPIGERSERKGIIHIPLPSGNMLLVIIAIGFCIFHILSAVFLRPPSKAYDPAPSLEQTPSSSD